MKNLKRVLALVIALVFVMGTVAFADTTTTTEEPAAYAKAQDLLGQLNVMVGDENGNFNADKTITKGEAARIIYSLLVEMGGTLPATNTAFSDVTSLYWGSGYINALNGASINGANVINGTGDGTFAPTKTLSYDEINTMLTIVLGYQPYAKRNGNFPFGYKASASHAKLYDNTFGTVSYGGAKEITRGEVAILVANALLANPMVPDGYTDNETSYGWATENFAKTNCGLDMMNGVVRTSGSKYTVGSSDALAAGTTKAKDAVGLNAIAFAKGTTLKAVVVTGVRASLASTTDKSKSKFDLSTEGKVKVGSTTYTIADGAKVTLNGGEVTIGKLADILANTETSSFKASVYGKDKEVNEIAVEIYSNGIVESIFKSTGVLKVKVDNNTEAKATSTFFTIATNKDTFTIDNAAGTVADAAANMVVKVSPIVANGDLNGSNNLTVVENKLVDVAAVGTNSSGSYYIDGTYYALNKDFIETVTLGKKGTFTLDVNNKVIAFAEEAAAAADEYMGYVTYYGVLSGRNAGKVTFDIVIDGKTIPYNTTDKLGDLPSGTGSYANPKTVAEKLYNQFNRYTFNANAVGLKQIASIKLDKDNNVTDIAFLSAAETGATYTYNKTLNKLTREQGAPIYLSSTSKVYTLDKNGKFVEKELSYLTNNSKYDGVVELTNFAGTAKVGIVITGSEVLTTTKKYAMAAADYTTEWADGTTYSKVSALIPGEAEAITLKSKAASNNFVGVKKGDYFEYEIDAAGNVTNVDVKANKAGFTVDKNAVFIEVEGTPLSTTSGYATIVEKKGVTVTYTVEKIAKGSILPATATFDVSNSVPVYTVDAASGNIVVGTVEDSLSASEIVVDNDTNKNVENAKFNGIYVNVNDKGEVVEIVLFTGLN